MKLFLKKLPDQTLVACGEETAEYLKKKAAGVVLTGEFVEEPNYPFLKKMHSLCHFLFDMFSEQVNVGLDYKGVKAVPDYDRFRKDLTILAGHYTCTYDIKGNVRVEAKSWAFAKTTEDQRQKIYSDLITAALKLPWLKHMPEQELREAVDRIIGYAS